MWLLLIPFPALEAAFVVLAVFVFVILLGIAVYVYWRWRRRKLSHAASVTPFRGQSNLCFLISR